MRREVHAPRNCDVRTGWFYDVWIVNSLALGVSIIEQARAAAGAAALVDGFLCDCLSRLAQVLLCQPLVPV